MYSFMHGFHLPFKSGIYTLVVWLFDLGSVFVQETFERAKAWVKELQRQASPNIVIALAGNKADLSEKRLVEYEVTHFLF